MRILFFGTPAYSVPTLAKLLDLGEEVVGVVTAPDRPQGRGKVWQPSAVATYALQHGLEVYKPQSLKDEEIFQVLAAKKPDLLVTIAYGRLLPERYLRLPRILAVNLHGSLLPRWRGAAPVQFALFADDKETGVTLMEMVRQLDAGPILAMRKVLIDNATVYGELLQKLSELSATLLADSLPQLASGTYQKMEQNEKEATYAGLISRDMELLDWYKPASALLGQIRGLAPTPGAYTLWQGKRLKMLRATIVPRSGIPGEVQILDQNVVIGTGKACILPLTVQLAGQKATSWHSFILGHPDVVTAKLGGKHEGTAGGA